ncbi:MAG TPA: carbohydrate kinase family protein [Chloroflexota bacterium]
MADVLCFGNLQFDLLCRTLTDLPEPGTIRMIEEIDSALSGNGGNTAAALARLGVRVDLAGYSGADLVGAQFRSLLATLGVGTTKLLSHPTAATGTSVVTLSPDGERGVFFVNGANALFNLDTVPDDWLHGPRIVSVGSMFVLPQFTGESVGRLLARARARGATTVLNVCWDGQDRGLPFLLPALAEADYFVLSYDEGRAFTGEIRPESILSRIETCTRGMVILTLGGKGCLIRTAAGLSAIPAVPVQAIDATGAGDCFIAGFIAALLHGQAPEECARLGCTVASYAVTGHGAYPRIPSYAEIERRADRVPQ